MAYRTFAGIKGEDRAIKKPETYKQWVKQVGRKGDEGAKALVSDKMIKALGEANIPSKIAPGLAVVIAEGFVRNGTRPTPEIEQWIEQDCSVLATEYGVAIESIKGDFPIEYLSLAYNTWQEGYEEVKKWRNKSLSSYLEYWLFHKKRGKKQDKLVRELLDKINPGWHD